MSDLLRKHLARLRGELVPESTPAPEKPKEPGEGTDADKKLWRRATIKRLKAEGKKLLRIKKNGGIEWYNKRDSFLPDGKINPPWPPTLDDLMSGAPAHDSVYEPRPKQETPTESGPVELRTEEQFCPLSGQAETGEATYANEQLSRIAGHDVYSGQARLVFRFESGKCFEHRDAGGAEVQIRLKKRSFKFYEDMQGRDVRVVNCKTAPGIGYILQDDGTWLPLNNKPDLTPPRPEFRPAYQPPAKPQLLKNLCDHPAGFCVGHCTSNLYEQTPLSRAPKS